MSKLSLLPVHGGPFNNMPAREVEIDDDMILCNDVVLPEEFNPNRIKLYVIGHEFGAICAVWSNDAEMFDIACDAGYLDCFAMDEAEVSEAEADNDSVTRCGNASEPFNLDNAWVQEVDLTPEKHWKLLVKFAYAHGAGQTNLLS